MSGEELVIAVVPHLIPAATVPNQNIGRAMSEPLATLRDEVLYLVCTHERVRFGERPERGPVPVLCARSNPDGSFSWESSPWAHVALPADVHPSAVPWAVIDPQLETIEQLPPIEIDPDTDPDGAEGQNRAELLPWIFDRHLEGAGGTPGRGVVEGGLIAFRVEYVGMSAREALRRATGAHHKVPQVLSALLLREPQRLVYFLPCDIRVTRHGTGEKDLIKLETLRDAPESTGIPRKLLTVAAEQGLIAWLGTPYNKQNTGASRFPESAAGRELAGYGVEMMRVGFWGLPDRVTLEGTRASVTTRSPVESFPIAGR